MKKEDFLKVKINNETGDSILKRLIKNFDELEYKDDCFVSGDDVISLNITEEMTSLISFTITEQGSKNVIFLASEDKSYFVKETVEVNF